MGWTVILSRFGGDEKKGNNKIDAFFFLFVLQPLQFPLPLLLFIVDFLNTNQSSALQEVFPFF